jgi:hypothetical protein
MEDLTNEKYGHLTILGRMDGRRGWCLAKCDCGNVKEVRAKYIRAGRVKTCGKCELGRRLMATRGRNRDTGPKGISMLYNRYVKQEMERGSTYILDHSVFTKKIQENCVFCGRSPLQRKKGPRIPYHGLVELVRGQVVTDTDLVPCCNKCERWKGQDNYIEFLEHVLKIRDHILRDRDEVANIR